MIQLLVQETGGSIRKVCSVLGEARSSFYHAAAPTSIQVSDTRIGDLIEAVFRRHRKRYGYRRIGEDLSDRGVTCAPTRIRRIMAQRGAARHSTQEFCPENQ